MPGKILVHEMKINFFFFIHKESKDTKLKVKINKALFYYIKLLEPSNNSLALIMQWTMPLISAAPSSKQGQELLWITSFLRLQINQQATQNKDFQFSISFLLDNSMLPTSHCLSSLDQKSISDSLTHNLSHIWRDLVQLIYEVSTRKLLSPD